MQILEEGSNQIQRFWKGVRWGTGKIVCSPGHEDQALESTGIIENESDNAILGKKLR